MRTGDAKLGASLVGSQGAEDRYRFITQCCADNIIYRNEEVVRLQLFLRDQEWLRPFCIIKRSQICYKKTANLPQYTDHEGRNDYE